MHIKENEIASTNEYFTVALWSSEVVMIMKILSTLLLFSI